MIIVAGPKHAEHIRQTARTIQNMLAHLCSKAWAKNFKKDISKCGACKSISPHNVLRRLQNIKPVNNTKCSAAQKAASVVHDDMLVDLAWWRQLLHITPCAPGHRRPSAKPPR